VLIDQLEIGPILFDPRRDPSQHIPSVLSVVADGSASDHRPLMVVVVVDFGYRNIKFAVEPGDQGFNAAAFLLE
jgi:hypothetical protein